MRVCVFKELKPRARVCVCVCEPSAWTVPCQRPTGIDHSAAFTRVFAPAEAK